MRYFCSVAAYLALGILTPSVIFGQGVSPELSIANYQLVSELRLTRSQWYATYSAKLSNPGAALPGVTATVTSLVSSVQVTPGQSTLHFRPVPANSQVASSDTFTILVDRDVPFDFANLKWSFLNPVADAGPNQTATVGSTVTLNGGASTNPNGAGTLAYSWSFLSRPAGSNAVLTNAQSVMSSFVIDTPGSYVLTLTVTNGAIQDKATVTVSTVNSPPVARAGPNQTAAVGSTITVSGSGSSDVDGDPLTYFWTLASRPAGSSAVIANFRTVSATLVADKPGAYVVQLVVNDSKADSAPSTVMITSGNTPPVASAGPSQAVTPGAIVQLSGAGSTDVDGDPLLYTWTLITIPANSTANLNSANAVNPTFTADISGTYVAQLVVNDGKIDSAPSTVTVTTNAVAAPVANAGPNQTVAQGATVTLSGSGSDPQGLPLTLTWSLITRPSASVAALSSSSVSNPTFAADKPGVYVAQLIVSNGTLNSAPSTVTITTSNTPPVANAGLSQNVATGATVTLDGAASSDADHDALTYSWSFSSRPPGSNATLLAPATRQPAFVADAAGTYVLQLIVNDGFANSAPATVTITANSQETLTFSPQTLTLNGTETQNLTLTLSAPAPVGGHLINISTTDAGIATVVSPTVTILANTTTVTVPVTGVTAGSAVIRAGAANLADATASITVNASTAGVILLPQVTVAPGDTIPFPVSLARPGPSAVYVQLTSSDSNKATVSLPGVSFAAGQTQPIRQPTLRGVAAGAATITASVAGSSSATSQVTVGVGVSLTPPSLTIHASSDGTLTLTLSGPAPSNVSFSLTSSNTGVATAPPSARISAGTSVISFKVTPVAPGSTIVKASAAGFADVTSNVTVQPPDSISLSVSSTTVQITERVPVTVTLSQPAPANGVTISLTSSDPSRAILAASSVLIPQGSTTGSIQLTGVNIGSTVLNASATGYTSTTLLVQVGTVISWVTPNVTIVGNGQQVLLDLRMFVTVPGNNNFSILDGLPISVTSSNPAVAVTPSHVNFFWDGSSVPTTRVQVTSVGPGTTVLHASGTNIPDVAMTVTVTGSPVTSPSPASIVASGGSSQITPIGTAFPFPLKVLVKDASNNPVNGATVRFAAPLAGAGGTFAGGVTAVTDATGTATSGVFTANGTTGTYAVTASVGALSTTFALTNTASGGTSQIATSQPPVPVSVSPASGNTQSQTFTFTFSDPVGAENLGVLNILINSFLDGRQACYLAYIPSGLTSGTLLLVNDAGAAGGPYAAMTIPGAGTISNSQCTISGVGSSVSGSGNTMTLTLATTFGASFPGNKVIYMAARDTAANNSGWQALGVWKVPGSTPTGPAVGGVSPARATTATQTYTFTFTNTNGYQDFAVLNILINSFLDGRNACYIAYVPSGPTTGTVLLVNDAGASGGPFQSMSVSGTGVAQNSQCAIGGVGSSVSGSGNTLTLTLPITFSQPFEGNRVIYAAARSNTQNSDWQSVGTVTIAGGPATITVMSGSPQSAPINNPFANALSVLVKDSANNPVSGAAVTFSAPASGPSGYFAGGVTTAITNASGIATAPAFTANGSMGSYVVTASVGAPATSFALSNSAGPAVSIAVVSGSSQNIAINAPFINPLIVLVKDPGNNPVPGALVTFSAPGSGASGAFAGGQNTAVTDGAGRATSALFVANGVAGQYIVTASAGAPSTSFSLTNQAPASLSVTTGSSQTATINAEFSSPLRVLVKDAGNNPVRGATVTFEVPGSGASGAFAGGIATAITDATGIATSTVFTANSTAGSYTVTASVGALSVGFALTNQVGPPASIAVVSGSPQSTVINTAFASALTVIVKDVGNNPISGALVTFSEPGSGASGAFAGGQNTAITDGTGTATSAQFTANSTSGTYSVTANVVSLSTSFALTNQAGPAASITTTGGSPQSTPINTPFAQPLTAIVKDASNNPVSGATVTFATPGSGATGSFAGNVTTATTDSTGTATSVVFTANATAGSYSVTASLGALTTNFALTNQTGPAASIAVTAGSPQSAEINAAFANVLTAQVKDAGNNPVSGVTVTFAAPGSGASGAFTGGQNTAITDATGTATSVVFTANATAGNYVVTASVAALSANFAMTNLVGPPAAITVTAGSPQSTAIGTPFANALRVIVKDAGNNPVSGVTVTFAAPANGASGAFAGDVTTAVTDATGTAISAQFSANSIVGSYTVTATVGALSTNFSLTNQAGPPASITVTGGSPQSVAINSPFASVLTVLVKDAGNNPVSGATVTFAAPGSGASGAFAGEQNTAITDATGTATSVVFSANSTAGSYSVTASLGALSATFALTNQVGPAASITVTAGSPQSTAIDTAFANTLSVIVKDAGSNPVSGVTVTFAAPGSGASGAFAGGQNTAVTDATGTATSAQFTANSTVGSYTVTASAAALSTNFALTNQAGPPASITVTGGSPQSVAINTPFANALTVLVKDAGNNPVSGATVTFAAPGSGASGSFTGGVTTTTTDATGTATSVVFTANATAGSYSVTASIGALSTSFALTNQVGPPASIAITSGSPQNTEINTAFASVLTVLVKDAGNNPVSGATVTFAAPGSGASGAFAGGQNTAVTDAAGTATSVVFTANATAGTYAVTASIGAVSTNFALTNHSGPATSIAVTTGSPQSTAINSPFANALTVVVKDAGNNPVSGATVTFEAPVSGATGSFAGGQNTAVTDATGVATSAVFTANATIGSYAVTATVGALSTSFALTNHVGPPASITMTGGSPQSTVINTSFANALTVLVKDAGNNPISGATVTFGAPGSGASGAFAGGQNTAVTDATGTATSVVFTANSTAGSYTITASLGALSTSFALTNQAGPAASIAVTSGSPQNTAIDTAFSNPLTVLVKDVGNNPVSGVTVTFAAPGSGASGVFAGGQNTAITDATGAVSSAQFTANNIVGSYAVTATVGAFSANFALANHAGPAASIAVTGGSGQSAAINSPFANSLSVLVKDAGNNPVIGATVTFATPGSGASGAFAGGVSTAVTDATGTATSAVFTANATAGSYSVTASLSALSTSFALTNQAGSPASITVAGGSPQSAGINSTFGNVLSVLVRDAGNNPVAAGATVTFAAPGSGASGSFAGGQNSAVTDATGTATSVAFTANGAAGSYSVTASVGALSTTFALTNQAGPAASITVTGGSPQNTAINSPFANPLTVQVKDAGNNPVVGVTVTFAAPGSGASGSFAGGQNTAVTDATGTATSAQFTANITIGSYSVTASVGALSTSFALTNHVGAPASITVASGSPQSTLISSAFGNALNVVVRDAGNNPVAGATVSFGAPGSGASGAFAGGQNTAVTDGTGTATSAQFIANTTAGSYSVTASLGALSTSFALTNQAGSPASITITGGSPQNAVINSPFANPLKVLVKDAGNNAVAGVTVTFAAPGSGASGAFAGGQNTAVTDATGTATSVVFTANNTVGSYTVTATLGALSTGFALNNQVGSPASITVTGGSPQSTVVGTPFATALTVLVKDAGNNPVAGATVTFAAPGSGASGAFAGAQNTATTDVTGTATSVQFIANAIAGNYSVTASVGALSTSFTLTNQAGSPASIALAGGSPQTTGINAPFANPLRVLVRDAGNNPVVGVTVTFAAPGSGASGSFAGGANTAVTDATGTATSAQFIANLTLGTYAVNASVGALSTSFSLTNQVGSAASIAIIGGSGQTAVVNTPFANTLRVLVKDAGNNPVVGATVTFGAPGSGASGAFAGGQNTAVTDASGTATSAQFTANGTAGLYTVSASTPGPAPANFSLTNTVGGGGAINISNVTVGKDLQVIVPITINPAAPLGGVTLLVQSSDSNLALVGTGAAVGQPSTSIFIAPGLTTVSTVVQCLASSGTVTMTLSAPGYANTNATVTLAPSGFVVASPNGIGAQLTTYQGVSTPLTVSAGRLDSSGVFVASQQLRGGFSTSVSVTSSVTSVGNVSSSSLVFNGGSDSATVNFVASGVNSGVTDVSVGTPFGFTPPSSGASVNVIVQPSAFVPFTATIGQNLEKVGNISLTGNASSNVTVTLTSNDPSKLKFSSTASGAGSTSINVFIPSGHTGSSDFYAQAFGSTGTVGYTIAASGYGVTNGSVTLAPSGFQIQSPGGIGAPTFQAQIEFGPANIVVNTGRLDSNGAFVESQLVAGGGSVSVSVVSSNWSVGTIATSPITIAGGSSNALTIFQPVALGVTTITASASQFASAQVVATLSGGILVVPSELEIGKYLQESANVILPAPAGASGIQVTVQSNSASVQLAATGTGAGSNSIVITVPAGQNYATFYVHALADSGTATYTATAPGSGSATGTVHFARSAIVIYPPFTSRSLALGSAAFSVFAATLDETDFPNVFQALAGGAPLVVPVTNSTPSVGTTPPTLTIQPGDFGATLTVAFLHTGSTTISLVQPSGFSIPSALGSATVSVTP